MAGRGGGLVAPPVANMNYANMIEEKNLKKGFIVATLVSTIVGTFTASMTLHDKIQERREAKKQKATDSKQDDEIKQLREEMKQIENGRRRSSPSSSRSRSSSRRRRRRRDDDYYDDERFARSAWRSRAMIEQAYEDNLRRIGNGYAQGDLLTENQLQAQIIQLQQTVINVLQDALYNGRRLTQADINRLVDAQNLARNGSLDALHSQYDRMNASRRQQDDQFVPLERAITTPAPYELKQLTYNSRQNSLPLATSKVKALPAPTPHLFCGYSEQLQLTGRALSPAFEPANGRCCPVCGVHIPVDSHDFWTLTVQVPDASGVRRRVDYELDARLIVKSHLEDGRFACVLCNKLSNIDCLCRDVEALVQHLGKKHTAEDYAIEPDLVKTTQATFSNERSKELVLRR